VWRNIGSNSNDDFESMAYLWQVEASSVTVYEQLES
jgi:hypothetical protein